MIMKCMSGCLSIFEKERGWKSEEEVKYYISEEKKKREWIGERKNNDNKEGERLKEKKGLK